MQDYIALIHKDAESDFGVSFPDFPGCVTAGRTLEEARVAAAEALGFHIDGLVEDGAELPAPASLDEVMAEAAARDAVAFLVPAVTVRRHVRVNVTLPEDVLARIDQVVRVRGLNRSAFLAAAAVKVIEDASV